MTVPHRSAAEAWLDAQAALGAIPADLLLRGGTVVNVFSHELQRADVAIRNGMIVAVREHFEGAAQKVLDASTLLIAPQPVAVAGGADVLRCGTFDELRSALRSGQVVTPAAPGAGIMLALLEQVRQHRFYIAHLILDAAALDLWEKNGPLELALRAGFSLTEIFEMSSLNPAVVLRLDQHFGSVSPGRAARLVLLNVDQPFPPHATIADGTRVLPS